MAAREVGSIDFYHFVLEFHAFSFQPGKHSRGFMDQFAYQGRVRNLVAVIPNVLKVLFFAVRDTQRRLPYRIHNTEESAGDQSVSAEMRVLLYQDDFSTEFRSSDRGRQTRASRAHD